MTNKRDPEWSRSGKFLWATGDQSAPCTIFGVPLDETTSFRPGTRFGPSSARDASYGLEEFSIRQQKVVLSHKYYDAGDLVLPFGNVRNSLDIIEQAASEILKANKKFFVVGGEHLITYPLVRSLVARYPDMLVIQFDAHIDFRSRYTGTEYSHATVMKRVVELLGPGHVYQLGIRSGDEDELEEAQRLSQVHFYSVLEPLKSILAQIGNTPVYITIDIDVVDPAFAPGTGTPEPGGITSGELLDSLSILAGKNIIGADLVEVAPAYDGTGQTGLLAAAIVRESLLLLD